MDFMEYSKVSSRFDISFLGATVKVQLLGKIKPAFYVIKWFKDGAAVDFSDAVDGNAFHPIYRQELLTGILLNL